MNRIFFITSLYLYVDYFDSSKEITIAVTIEYWDYLKTRHRNISITVPQLKHLDEMNFTTLILF